LACSRFAPYFLFFLSLVLVLPLPPPRLADDGFGRMEEKSEDTARKRERKANQGEEAIFR